MKVLVVIGCIDYSPSTVLGVFTQQVKAEECKEKHKEYYDDIDIEEFTVDE